MDNEKEKRLAELELEHSKLVAQRQKYTQRRLIRVSLIMKKAVEKGIIVTDAEVDAEIKKRAK
jgi:hypothetical protein